MNKFRTFHVTSLGFSREAVKRMLLEAWDLAIQLRSLLLKPRSVVASNLSTFERSVLSSESRNLVLLSFVRFVPIRNLGNKTKKKIGAKIIRAPFDRKKNVRLRFFFRNEFFWSNGFFKNRTFGRNQECVWWLWVVRSKKDWSSANLKLFYR